MKSKQKASYEMLFKAGNREGCIFFLKNTEQWGKAKQSLIVAS